MALRKGPSPAHSSSLGWKSELQTNQANVPDLEIKLGALVILLFATLLCGFIPLCIVRGAGRCNVHPETRRSLLSLMSCFAGGVFLATCLLDLMPVYLDGINEAFNSLDIKLNLPLPEFIMAMGFFLVLTLEQIVLALREQSSGSSEERRALLVDGSVQSDNRDGPRHSHHHHGKEEFGGFRALGGDGVHLHVDLNSHSTIRAFILVFSLSLHSVLEGLTVGLRKDSQKVLEICLALLLHKSILSFSLALKLAQGQLRRPVVAGCILCFAAMSPLGIGLGFALAETKWPSQYQLVRCTLAGLVSGTFIYITFLEILPHELGSPRSPISRVAMLLTGFAVITGVLFIQV